MESSIVRSRFLCHCENLGPFLVGDDLQGTNSQTKIVLIVDDWSQQPTSSGVDHRYFQYSCKHLCRFSKRKYLKERGYTAVVDLFDFLARTSSRKPESLVHWHMLVGRDS